MYLRSDVAMYFKGANHYLFFVLLKDMYSTNNKAFYLETDFISGENLACHLTLSNTTISSEDSFDSFCHSQMQDF